MVYIYIGDTVYIMIYLYLLWFIFYIIPICEPWCWYIYLQNRVIIRANVGKYSSTMEY